jgi:hypothetical protein
MTCITACGLAVLLLASSTSAQEPPHLDFVQRLRLPIDDTADHVPARRKAAAKGACVRKSGRPRHVCAASVIWGKTWGDRGTGQLFFAIWPGGRGLLVRFPRGRASGAQLAAHKFKMGGRGVWCVSRTRRTLRVYASGSG